MRQATTDHRRTGGTLAVVAAIAMASLAASAEATVRADFNDDGFEDLAIGIEGEDLPAPDNVLNAGAVTVIYGSSAGLDPAGSPADQFWHEEVAGVRGSGKGDDGFGDAVAAGDFDGDGRTDLAIGATGDDIRGKDYAGSVRVLYGANNGLTADGDDLFTEATKGVPGNPADDDELGKGLAAGDFDGDGRDDLAASIRCQRVDGEECAGAVLVFHGTAGGLRSKGTDLFSEDTKGIAGAPEAFDGFGTALAAGDFDGKGPDELAVGVPFDDIGSVDAGSVRVLSGSARGLTPKGDRRIHAGQGTIEGDPEADDQFGAALASGRVDGGADDLAVGVPGDDDQLGGAVNVLFGGSGGPSVQGSELWSQGTTDVLGTPETGDSFGESVAIGNLDGEDRGDLAIGAPGDNDAGFESAGAVNVLYGDGTGLSAAGDQQIHQDVVFVEGTAEAVDQLGSALASGDFDDEDGDDLAITVAFDDAGAVDGAGSVQAFYGSNPDGLGPSDDFIFHQGLPEIQNEPTENEFFGDSLAAGW